MISFPDDLPQWPGHLDDLPPLDGQGDEPGQRAPHAQRLDGHTVLKSCLICDGLIASWAADVCRQCRDDQDGWAVAHGWLGLYESYAFGRMTS